MRAPRIRLSLVLFAVFHLLAAAPAARAINIEFSNLAPFQTFPNASLPQTIDADGVPVELTKYNSSASANGTILNSPQIGNEPNALFLAANLRAEILLSAPSTGGYFFFLDQGGQNYLEINGELMDFTDTALTGGDLHFVGGVSVHSSPTPVADARSVKLEGSIDSIAFIGQELLIDRINLTLVPEPATWITLGLGGAAVLVLRRRRASPS
jgi:hypothetical protein